MIYRFIIPLGITAIVLLIFTVISGIKRWKLKYHKMLAILTLVVALIHAILVLVVYL